MKKFYAVLLSITFFFIVISGLSVNAAPIRVGVADFVDRANSLYSASTSLKEVTNIFTKILAQSSSNIEVTNSKSFQTLNGVTIENFVNVGKTAGCQYVVLGALINKDINTEHSYKESGFLLSVPTLKETIYTYAVTLDLRVIEMDTGKIVFSTSGTGNASYAQDMKEATKNALLSVKRIKEEENRHDKMNEQALSVASSMAAEKVCTFLTGEYPEVSSIKANSINKSKKSKSKSSKNKKNTDTGLGTINVNRGSSTGVSEGTYYKIFFEGEEVFDFGGHSLGREKFNVAVAEVKNAKTDYSTASVTGGIFENIREGDKAEQITLEEAQSIIARNDFARNRISEFLR